MSRRTEIIIAIVGVTLTAITLIFGDNIYLQITGHSFAQDFRSTPNSQTISNPGEIPSPVTQNTLTVPETTPSVPKLTQSDFGRLLYEDNFESDTGVWSLDKGNQFQNGMLILSSPHAATYPSWHTEYSDFVFETEFQFIDPVQSEWSAMSVYLRFAYSPCPGNTSDCRYQIAVSTAGEVAVWRPKGTNNNEQLLANTYASGFIPNSTNRLTIIAKGDEFRIFLNGDFVRSFYDSTYKSGIIVLGIDSVPVAFNYIRIYATTITT